VRDTLRKDEALRNDYERIKREPAKTKKREDLHMYSVSKTPIIRKILKTAGWTDGDVAEMEAGNQRVGRLLPEIPVLGDEDGELVEGKGEQCDS